MLSQKDRKSASLFGGHVNPLLSVSNSLLKNYRAAATLIQKNSSE